MFIQPIITVERATIAPLRHAESRRKCRTMAPVGFIDYTDPCGILIGIPMSHSGGIVLGTVVDDYHLQLVQSFASRQMFENTIQCCRTVISCYHNS